MKKDPYIRNLISQGEHETLDFKFGISDPARIARSVSAFANTFGGILLIGVKDNGSIAGIRTGEELYMAEAAVSMYCRPKIPVTYRQWIEEGRSVLEMIIPKIDGAICYAKSPEGAFKAWVRVNDNNILAPRILLKIWNRKIKNEPTRLIYTDHEKRLLAHLDLQGEITTAEFARIAGISTRAAETILVNMVMIDIIDIQIEEKRTVFTLKSAGYK